MAAASLELPGREWYERRIQCLHTELFLVCVCVCVCVCALLCARVIVLDHCSLCVLARR